MLLEFIFEFILEIAMEVLKSEKVPKPIRVTIFIFYFLILFATIIFCLYIGIIGDIHVLIKIVFFLVAVALYYLLIKLIRLVVE